MPFISCLSFSLLDMGWLEFGFLVWTVVERQTNDGNGVMPGTCITYLTYDDKDWYRGT